MTNNGTQKAKIIWRYSWVLTLPLSIFFIVWATNTVMQYNAFAIKYNTTPVITTLHNLGSTEFKYLLKTIHSRARPRDNAQYPAWRNIHLFVPENHIRQLNANLPTSGFKYVKGKILNDDKLTKVKIRYRGDNSWHWAGHQKSIRIKTTKKKLFEGMRKFNLIIPKTRDQVSEYLAYRLASEMGLVTPHVEMINLFINGEYDGFRMLVEQLEEVTLRRNNLLPGDLYAGEMIGRDLHAGANGTLFDNPGLWSKTAINNHYDSNSFSPLKTLTDLLQKPESSEKQSELAQLLDMEYWGLFSAFEVLSQGQHYNNSHNWRLYYDPGKGKFIPIIWDPLGWYLKYFKHFNRPADLDILTSDLHAVLHKNGDFIQARNNAIALFFESEADRTFLEEVENIIPDTLNAILVAPNLLDMDHATSATKNLTQSIKETFQHVKQHYLQNDSMMSYFYNDQENVFSIIANDRDIISSIKLAYDTPLTQAPSVILSYYKSGKKISFDISPSVTAAGNEIEIRSDLMANYNIEHDPSLWPALRKIVISPTTYQFTIKNLSSQTNFVDVTATGLSQKIRAVEKQQSPLPIYDLITADPLFSIKNNHPPEIWSDIVLIKGYRVVDNPIIILPGTHIKMMEDSVLVFNNKVTANGTADNKIQITREHSNSQPWGSVVIQGPHANDSVFNHCIITGGSGYKDALREYSGMFSIHNTQGIDIINCSFSNGSIVDDMVHIVYSEVDIDNSSFSHAHSDALDIDISRVSIKNSRFAVSGNDAVDLMNSLAIISGTSISHSQDKAISVGENSVLVMANSILEKNQIAVQTKDSSLAYLFNSEILNNNIGIDCYKKNWQYGAGGHTSIFKSILQGNNTALKSDKKSSIQLYDTLLGKGNIVGNNLKRPRIIIDKLSLSNLPTSKNEAADKSSPLSLDTNNTFIESSFQKLSAFHQISLSTRGTTND